MRAGLYNISLNNTREDIIRAFLEGVAFNTRWLLKPVEKFMGRSVQQINMAGGGGNSDVWCQIFADVLNVEVRQVQRADSSQCPRRGLHRRGRAWRDPLQRRAGTGQSSHLSADASKPLPCTMSATRYFVEIYRQMKGVYRKLNEV